MLNKFKPYLLIVLLFSFVFFWTDITGASDASLTCSDSGCSGIAGAIFNEGNMAPGDMVTKTLTVINNYSEPRNFGVQVSDTNFNDSTPSLAQEMIVVIKDTSDSSVLYGPKTLNEWKSDGLVNLSQIANGSSKEFIFEVNFNDVGNEYQEKSLSFDLIFGFEGGGSRISSPSTSSGSQVLGVSSGNTLGQVLGLSATGGRFWILFVVIGVILLSFGGILTFRIIRRNRS